MHELARILIRVALAAAIAAALALLAILAVASWTIGRDVSRGLGDITEAEAADVFHRNRQTCEAIRKAFAVEAPDSSRALGVGENTDPQFAEVERGLRELGGYLVYSKRRGDYRVFEIYLASCGNIFSGFWLVLAYAPDRRPTDFLPTPENGDILRHTALGNGWYVRYQTY